VVQRIAALLNQHGRAVRGTRVLLLGMTYKAATSDWRESPSVVVADQLGALGAQVVACDPHITAASRDRLPVELVEYSPESLRSAEIVAVLVDHPEFDADEIAREAPLVFDAKGMLRGRTFAGECL
jgi:UDP-N-acetyl-D-glucosamine dehydrogenase